MVSRLVSQGRKPGSKWRKYRAQFVDDFKSGAFMNSLYQHRAETRGRYRLLRGWTKKGKDTIWGQTAEYS
jgi:hypothetical protein